MPRYFLLILMSMVILSPLAIDIFLPALPTMAKEFGVGQSQVQSTITFFMFAMGFGQILIGPIADRIGRKPVAFVGIVLYGLSGTLGAMSHSFEVLQLARILQGFAACATSIVVFSSVRDCYSHKESSRIYSYLNGAICVIPALAPSFGGLLSLQFGWRSTFFFMVFYAIVVLFIVGFLLTETKPANTQSSGKLYQWQRYQPILSNSHFVFYASCCMFGMGSILTYVTYAPIWLIDHLGVSSMSFSLLFGLNAFVNIIACFVAPQVIKRFGNRPTVIIAFIFYFIAAGLEAIGYWFGPSSGMLAALSFMLPMILLCIGFALLLGPATSMALSAFGERAGTAAALLGCIQMSGASILTSLIQQTGLSAPMATMIMMGGGSILLLVIMFNERLSHWHKEATN